MIIIIPNTKTHEVDFRLQPFVSNLSTNGFNKKAIVNPKINGSKKLITTFNNVINS